MSPPSSSQLPLFEQVKQKFDLDRLQSDLEEIGQIDPRDWEFLKGVLCGFDQGEIAKQCHVKKETVKVALSRRVRLHILRLFPDKKNVDWKRLPGWLIEAGYGIGENHRVNWQQVCRTMLDRQKKLSTNEVIASEAMQFDLLDDEIFISLALVERKEPERLSQNVHPARPLEQYEEKPPIEYEKFREQILRQGKSDRIAIVGEPGAGKTTLLQHIAFWILDKELGLPIWISLGDLIKNGDLQRLKDYLTQVWLDDALSNVTQDVKSDFLKQLNEQRVWLLLDGADEIVASSGIALREINSQLRGWLSQSCIILTCRINVWEVDINALRDFQTYRTKEFHYPTQVEQFIESGFRKSNQQSGERLKTELANTERTRLQQLVRNPLRLMMLCTTWHEQESLPATKAELYKRFVSEFYKWNRSKWKKKDLNYAFFPNTVAKQEKLNKALGRLACRALDEESSPFRLPHNLVSDELGEPDEDGSDFWLALNLGWLQVARDSDKPPEKVYTFFHPTLQEYFAARAINDWRKDFLKHVSENPMQGIYRIFESHWKEVILLWLGRENVVKEQKETFIEALVKFEDGWENFYEYQAYFLASAGIAEFDDFSDPNFADEIVEQLIYWSFGYFDSENQRRMKFPESIEHGAGIALQETDSTKAIKALTRLLQEIQNDSDQFRVAAFILDIDSDNPKAIATLTDLLRSQHYREAAASILLDKNPNHPKAKNVFDSQEKKNSQDEINRMERAIESIKNSQLQARQAIESSNDVQALIHQLRDNFEIKDGSTSVKFTFTASRERLVEIATGSIDVIDALIALLLNHPCEFLYRQIISIFEKILNKNSLVSLVVVVKTYLSESVCRMDCDSYRYCMEIMSYCAQNMTYPDFYQAWHQTSIHQRG